MTKAIQKIAAGLKEAIVYAKCRHKWERLSTRVKDRMVVATYDRCERCGAKRHRKRAAPTAQIDRQRA